VGTVSGTNADPGKSAHRVRVVIDRDDEIRQGHARFDAWACLAGLA
jgi:hypothetical protein